MFEEGTASVIEDAVAIKAVEYWYFSSRSFDYHCCYCDNSLGIWKSSHVDKYGRNAVKVVYLCKNDELTRCENDP